MKEMKDLLVKIPTLMQVAVECQKKEPVIHSFRDMTYCLQMVFYWWRSAYIDIHGENQSEQAAEEQAEAKRMFNNTPTLVSVVDKMNYIENEITELAEMTEEYLSEAVLSPSVLYKVQQGYTNVMETMFNNEISKQYYEQFRKYRRDHPKPPRGV